MRIREQPLPGEAEAAARSWPVVEAALAEQTPARRSRRPRRLALRLALVAAPCAWASSRRSRPPAPRWATGSGIASPTGRSPRRPPSPACPRGESVLAISRSGAYAVHPDGGWRRLGSFSEAGWSPRGLNVVGVDGRRGGGRRPGRARRSGPSRGPAACTTRRGAPGSASSWRTSRATCCGASAGDGDGDDRAAAPRRGARHAGVAAARRPRARLRARARRARGGGRGARRDALARGAERPRSGPRASSRGRAMAGGWWRSRHGRSRCSTPSGRVLRTVALPGPRPPARAPSLGHAGGRGGGGAGGTRVLDIPLARRGQRRGSSSRATWTASPGRATAAACCSRGATPTSGSLLGPDGRVRRALHGVSAELGAAGGFPRLAGWCCPG